MLFLIALLLLGLAGFSALKLITRLATRCATEEGIDHHVEAVVTPIDGDGDATTAGPDTAAMPRGAVERLDFVHVQKSWGSPIHVSMRVLVQSFLGEASVVQLSRKFPSKVKAPWTFTLGEIRNSHQNATIERAVFQEAAFCVPSPGRIWGAKISSSVNNANHGSEPVAHVFCVMPLLYWTYSGGNHIACEQIDPVGKIVALSTCPTFLFVATLSEVGSSRTRLDSESLCTLNVLMRSLLDIMSGVYSKPTQPTIIWAFLVRAQSVIASRRTAVASYGRLLAPANSETHRSDTPKIASGKGFDRNNRGPAMTSIVRIATSRNGEEPATSTSQMISSAIYVNPPRPWAERQDVQRASMFCSGAFPSQQDIFLVTNAGGGIGPVVETWILERRPIAARGWRRLTSSPRGRPPSLPRQNPLPLPSTSGDLNLGFPLRADNGVPVSSSRATYLVRNQAMAIVPTLRPPPCGVLGVSKKGITQSLNHDAGCGGVTCVKSRVAEITFCLPRYRICEPYRIAFTDILNHSAGYGHTTSTFGTNGHRQSTCQESTSQEEITPGRGEGEMETKSPPPSIDPGGSPIHVSMRVLVQSFLGEASVIQLSRKFPSKVKAPWTFTLGEIRNSHQNATIERAVFQEAAFCVPSPGRIWGAKISSSVNNTNHRSEPVAHVFCVMPLLYRTYSGGNHTACEQIDPVSKIVALSTCQTYLFVATLSEVGSSRTRLDSEWLCTPSVLMGSLLDIMSGVCSKPTQPTIIWAFLVRTQSVIASRRTSVAGYGRLLAPANSETHRSDTPKIASGKGFDRNNRGPAMTSIVRIATSRNGEEPATSTSQMISSAIYVNPPRPWAERQDVQRASMFCSGAFPSQQDIFLVTNAGGGIGPVVETWILERRPIAARGWRRLTSSPRGRPPSLPRQNPLPLPSTSGDLNLGFPLRADNGVPVSSSRATYLVRNQAMAIAPTLHPPPCGVLGVSKKGITRSLNHDAGYGGVTCVKSRVAEITFCLPRYRICEPYRIAFTDILNHSAGYGHTTSTFGTNGHRQSTCQESTSQEEITPGRGEGEMETKSPPPSIDRPNGHTRLRSRCSEKAKRNGWHLNVLPTDTPPSSRLAADYPMPTRSESNWPTRLSGVIEKLPLPRVEKGLSILESLRMTTNTAGRSGRSSRSCSSSSSSKAEGGVENAVASTSTGKRLSMLESLRMTTNTAGRSGISSRSCSSKAEVGIENAVASTPIGDIGSKGKQEAVRAGRASKRPLSDLAKLIMPRTMHGIRRRRNQFKHVVRVKTPSQV